MAGPCGHARGFFEKVNCVAVIQAIFAGTRGARLFPTWLYTLVGFARPFVGLPRCAKEAKELSNQVTRLNVELLSQQKAVEKFGNSIDALRLEINREPNILQSKIDTLSKQIETLQSRLPK